MHGKGKNIKRGIQSSQKKRLQTITRDRTIDLHLMKEIIKCEIVSEIFPCFQQGISSAPPFHLKTEQPLSC